MSKDADDEAFFHMFAGLRARVIEVLEGFDDRVREQIDESESQKGPVASDAATAVLGQLVGLVWKLTKGSDDVGG
ncbi:MAG: hypothetical protein KTR31_37245 [Myxococcales bacterium]|nr:hypothetical protein [Myxococcales bacterium]